MSSSEDTSMECSESSDHSDEYMSVEEYVDEFFLRISDGIKPEHICTCGQIGDCFLECAVCEGKCCVFCVPNGVDFDICPACYNNDNEVRTSNKCDLCNNEWTFISKCSCHPDKPRFKVCANHTMICKFSGCENAICESNGPHLCPEHNVTCSCCSKILGSELTCVKCCFKTCTEERCKKRKFPLKNIHQYYPTICVYHYPYNRCRNCQSRSIITCFEPGCFNKTCYNLQCDGVFKPQWVGEGEKIQSYCYAHRSHCDLCQQNSKTEWLTVPEPLKYSRQGAYIGYPKLCEPCFQVVSHQYLLMCMVFNKFNIKMPRDIKTLLLKQIASV